MTGDGAGEGVRREGEEGGRGKARGEGRKEGGMGADGRGKGARS